MLPSLASIPILLLRDQTPIVPERYSREPLVTRNPHIIVVGGLGSSGTGFSGPVKAEFYIRIAVALKVVGPVVIGHRVAVS
jgi:hypothetical protein